MWLVPNRERCDVTQQRRGSTCLSGLQFEQGVAMMSPVFIPTPAGLSAFHHSAVLNTCKSCWVIEWLPTALRGWLRRFLTLFVPKVKRGRWEPVHVDGVMCTFCPVKWASPTELLCCVCLREAKHWQWCACVFVWVHKGILLKQNDDHNPYNNAREVWKTYHFK